MAQTIFVIILSFVALEFLLSRLIDFLDDKQWSRELPEELKEIYDEEKYSKAREYDRARSRLGFVSETFSFLLILAMLFFDGFAFIDNLVRQYTEDPIWMSLLFFGIIVVAADILSTPFSLYSIFVIEEKFGFNKTTRKTWFFDKIKGAVLGGLIGGGLLAVLTWFYETAADDFWIYAWVLVSGFSIFMATFYTSLIVPIFNKLTPLPAGELRDEIEKYANSQDFDLKNIFVIDGSKRSTKANAYFSGLGAKKSIVLYDTLIENHTTEGLVAVLAHEIGHYKKKHTLLSVFLSVIQTGVTLFILSLVLDTPAVYEALGTENMSFHFGILVFGMLYSPISMILGIAMNALSRKNEYEADAFAKKTYNGEALQNALKKLSTDNLSNLTPHPLHVFLSYSHPTLLQRLQALKN